MTRTSARLLLGLAAGLLLMLLPSPAAAQTACGGPGQRGCCVASTERLSTGACSSGLVEVAGVYWQLRLRRLGAGGLLRQLLEQHLPGGELLRRPG